MGKVLSVWTFFAFIWIAFASNFPTDRLMRHLQNGVINNLTYTIESGMDMARSHCQAAFEWDRWNCPESVFSSQNQVLTKEFAYVQAITAAGLLYAVTKNCSRGALQNCGCDPHSQENEARLLQNFEQRPRANWVWGRCSDNMRAAEQIVKKLLHKRKDHDVQSRAEQQNVRIGRKVVKQSLVKRCECESVLRTCAVKTCWMELPPFAEIAKTIKDLYWKAYRLDAERFTRNSVKSARVSYVFPIALIYIFDSPDYCRPDVSTGFLGTSGRKCSKTNREDATTEEKDSCRNLCRSCKHRVKKEKKIIKRDCNCKFIWCCRVECEICMEEIEDFFCE